jgi:chemotaxis protein MotB
MSRKKRKKVEVNTQEWLTTYSDMMTLLLCFFVLLYAFSTMNAKKFKEISWSLNSAFGGQKAQVITNGGSIGPVPVDDYQEGGDKEFNTTAQIYSKVEKYVKDNNLEAKVQVREDIKGIAIEIQEEILFDSGSAEIKSDSIPVLDKIAGLLKMFPNNIIIEGHTDNVPINKGYYESNWELSADRAVKVLRYMVEKKGFNSEKFTAIGCGEFKPIASNDTPEGRQKNRRVSILIVTTDKESSVK